MLACLRSDCTPTHLLQSRRVGRDGATVLGHLVFVVERMLLPGHAVEVVDKLRHGRDPTLSVYLVCDDISVALNSYVVVWCVVVWLIVHLACTVMA